MLIEKLLYASPKCTSFFQQSDPEYPSLWIFTSVGRKTSFGRAVAAPLPTDVEDHSPSHITPTVWQKVQTLQTRFEKTNIVGHSFENKYLIFLGLSV